MFHCTYLVPMPTVCFIRRFFFRYWSSHVFPWTAMFFMVGILLLFLYAFESIRSSHGLKSSAFGRRPQKFGVIFHLFWHLLSKSADLSKLLEDNCEILWSSQKSRTLRGYGRNSYKKFCWFFGEIWRHQKDILKLSDL